MWYTIILIFAIISTSRRDDNMSKKIGVFDSGLGGLSILKELVKVLPNED